MESFDPTQGLRRSAFQGALLVAISLFPVWVGWHVPDMAMSTFRAGAARADVVRLVPIAHVESAAPEPWVRYVDEAGDEQTQAIDNDPNVELGRPLRVGDRIWIWYVRGEPNLTQAASGEVMIRAIFAAIALPALLPGLFLLARAGWIYRRRRRALRAWLRLPIALPGVEEHFSVSYIDRRQFPHRQFWRLSARVFHAGAWRDVRSDYVMSEGLATIPTDALPPVFIDPDHPDRHWLPIPTEWIGPTTFFWEMPKPSRPMPR